MNAQLKDPLVIIAVFLWIGFVCAISFMEAWLKFRAPGVTLPVGLGIGRLVFSALNKAEIIFAAAIITGLLLSKQELISTENIFFVISLAILLLQTLWLLPALDARAEMHIRGMEVPRSLLHYYYVMMEIAKVSGLFFFGIKQFK